MNFFSGHKKLLVETLLAALFLFVACKKSDVSKQKENRLYPPIDTSIIYLSNQIEYHFLKWVVHEDQHLLTADLNVSKPYLIQKVVLVHAEGGLKSFDIPKYNGTFTPTLYYKTDSGKVTIYAYYSGNVPPARSEFEKENEYLKGLYLFGLDNMSIGIIKIFFDPLINGDEPEDSSLLDELTYLIHWVPDSVHSLSATLDIPNGYAVSDTTVVTAFGVDTVVVPRYDSSKAMSFYYRVNASEIVLHIYTDDFVPIRERSDNVLAFAIAYAEWAAHYSPLYTSVKVKFK